MGKIILYGNNNLRLFNPELAQLTNLNVAIVVQQVYYWMERNREAGNTTAYRNGEWWMHSTIDQMHERDFPFLSKRTIQRAISDAKAHNIIKTEYEYKDGKRIFTWYTVDMNALYELGTTCQNGAKVEGEPTCQNGATKENKLLKTKIGASANDTAKETASTTSQPQVPEIVSADDLSNIVSLVNASTSTDGMTLQDIADVYPYSVSEIRKACQQASLDGLIVFDGISDKAYKLTDYSKPVVTFDDLPPHDFADMDKTSHSNKYDDIKDAIIKAFGWKDLTLTDNERGRVGKAAKQLSAAGVYADEIASLHGYCTRFDNITPPALCNHLNNWRTASKPKNPSRAWQKIEEPLPEPVAKADAQTLADLREDFRKALV